ncbi:MULTISPECIES: phosphatidate cytidylyltransferase [Sphingobacterium]|jgi:phosphatidate cytidylyltransferase|uniref:phosphatidate cytidylyltransferase n=1 Tax=Sphingobacterium TaxID=28453 RepID=UPI00257D42B0|nr:MULTISPECIES: phosphatidate cytidylyltransferase [Sphingobacterium]
MADANGKFADVPVRVRSWGYIVLVLAVAFVPPTLSPLFVAWITFQGMCEFARMFIPEWKANPFVFLSMAMLQALLLYFCSYQEYLVLASFMCLGTALFFNYGLKVKKGAVFGLFFGAVACLLAFSHLAFIRSIKMDNNVMVGLKLIGYIVVLTELNDVFQYLMGKFFGKRKIVPRISPNKTIAGCVGGIGLTIILSNLLGYFLLPFQNFLYFSLFGLFFGILGFWGDVLFSYLKRKAGVKDTGSLIPGHGGLLDRIDSLIFNAPLFYALIILLLGN